MKKLLAMLLSLSMVFALVGCGGAKTEEPETDTPVADVEDTDDTEDTEETEGKQDGFVIGFSNGYFGNTWRSQMIEDFEIAADEYKAQGIISDYIVANTDSDVTEQINQLNSMIESGVDALMIDAASPTSIKSVVDAALAKDILVVITNDPAAYEGTVAVCGDNISWQRIQANWLAEKIGGKGDIVEITGEPGNAADTLRQETNKEILADYPDINVLASVPGKWSQTEAQSVMTTLLSSYNNIDAILTQDVMAEGIMKAYENSGETLPIMTGDSVKSFFMKWQDTPELDSIGIPYAPGVAVTALDVTIKLLQGETLDESIFEPNPMDETLVNAILVDPPYVVTKDGDQDAPWMEGLVGTKAITVEEALEILKDSPDTASLDGWLSLEEVSKWFK